MSGTNGYSTEDRIINALTEEGVVPTAITATPLTFANGQMTEGKSVKVKFVTTPTEKGLLSHELTLPKLSKKQPYRIYRIDFVINGKVISRIIGQEHPVEEEKR